ncbi:acetylglutamate kinase [Sungkyunkwania multivorans]|uniref:Acetylglutamate kinase n=1 Tax=Sungkyunkwania multivorans TaxID=1173618 RepID=A0ABW3CVM3_9FLAO
MKTDNKKDSYRRRNNKINVIKIGGNVIEDEAKLTAFLKDFAAIDGQKVLVHGGGKLATLLAEKLGIPAKMHQGRRITDAQTLEVITMVYGGLTNKNIVAKLQGFGCNAVGLSGADANTIVAHKRPVRAIDYGFAGDIDHVDGFNIKKLLEIGLTPVFCAISHDKNGQLLNTNADTIAAEVAIALSEFFDTTLYYCFEKNGVLRNVEDENSVIEKIDKTAYNELKREGIIADGMLPKMHNCFHALDNKVVKVCIGNATMFTNNRQLFTTLTL